MLLTKPLLTMLGETQTTSGRLVNKRFFERITSNKYKYCSTVFVVVYSFVLRLPLELVGLQKYFAVC